MRTIAKLILLCASAVFIGNARAEDIAESLANGSIDVLQKAATDSQAKATLNVFLGRPDLNASLIDIPRASSTCSSDGARLTSAGEWLGANALQSRLIMFNENHYAPEARTFVRGLLPQLRKLGFTHIGFETFPAPWDVKGAYTPASGHYSVEPMFAALVRDAGVQGFTVFGYETTEMAPAGAPMEELIGKREQGESDNLKKIITAAPADARFIIYAGWSHIRETPQVVDGTKQLRWLANRLKADTGIDPLTVDLTSCVYTAASGDAREGRLYLDSDGSPRVQGQYEGAVDAQIHLAVPGAGDPNAAGFFRSALGKPVKIPQKLHPAGTTVLVEARGVDQPPKEVAFDRVLLAPGDQLTVYLAPGKYELVAHRTDGALAGRQRLTVK